MPFSFSLLRLQILHMVLVAIVLPPIAAVLVSVQNIVVGSDVTGSPHPRVQTVESILYGRCVEI